MPVDGGAPHRIATPEKTDGAGGEGTSGPVPPEAPPWNRMLVALLSLVGFFVSFYLLAHALGWTGPLLCGVGDCATVQASEYAWIGPMPVAGIGAAGYLALLTVALLGIQPRWRDSSGVAALLFGGTLIGVAFSGWLTYLEAAVIQAWCQWCVISAVLIGLAFLASIPELGRLTESRGGEG